jgi:hypothetical protein
VTRRTRVFFRTAATVLAVATVGAAHLGPAAVVAWDAYAAAVEARIGRDLGADGPFLDVDRPASLAARRAALRGELVVRSLDDEAPSRDGIENAGALPHHWRGTVFLPRVSIADILDVVRQPPPAGPDLDVMRATVLGRRPNGLTIYLRVQKRGFVNAVYDTEHAVTFEQIDARRAISRSVATRIAEVLDAGTPTEHLASPGDDHGYLWRLNAYWRYEAAPDGVLAECESITLSRGVPFGLGYVASPLIERAARESMTRTLDAFRNAATLNR